MVKNDRSLRDEIVHFINEEKYNSFGIFKKRIDVTRQTKVEKDLCITGDDADDFMFEFTQRFPFKIGDFKLGDYFDSEGFLPLPIFKKRKKTKPLTLGMLEQAVIDGVWNSEKLDRIYLRGLRG